MDLFTVNLDGSRGTQIHDFSFGIPPSGLFWTAAVPEDSVEGELDDGFVSFRATKLSVRDALDGNWFAFPIHKHYRPIPRDISVRNCSDRVVGTHGRLFLRLRSGGYDGDSRCDHWRGAERRLFLVVRFAFKRLRGRLLPAAPLFVVRP